MNTEALRKIYRTHPLVIEAAAEIERLRAHCDALGAALQGGITERDQLRAERDEWKAKWISLAQASLIAGTMTLEQKADTE